MKARKIYNNDRVYVEVTCDNGEQKVVSFASERDMRRMGECLVDLARIGGSEVEIR